MAAITNTFLSSAAKGNREDLSDIVSRITPEDTPIYSMIGKESCSNISPEWEIDTLAAPASNAFPEGDQYTYAAVTAVSRVKNHCQIMRKDWVISKTQEAVTNAGNAEKIKEVRLKRGIEIKKDTELALVSNTASVATGTRLMGGLPSWLTTNVSRGASGVNGGYSSGTGLTVAETTGTQRAFTKALLDTTMQSCYQSGGNVNKVVVSPYVKSVFVTFMSDTNVAVFRNSVEAGEKRTIIATADMYEGPFGKVMVVPNRVMATSAAVARRAFLLDSDLLSMKVLRKIQDDKDLASNADATTGVLIGEHTLAVKNEAGLGAVCDVFGLTAAS
jgi:hypothetical protein